MLVNNGSGIQFTMNKFETDFFFFFSSHLIGKIVGEEEVQFEPETSSTIEGASTTGLSLEPKFDTEFL